MINWESVGVISGVVFAGGGGLYKAIRDFSGDIRRELGDKLDAVGEHLTLQDARIDDARTRIARVEGSLGIHPKD